MVDMTSLSVIPQIRTEAQAMEAVKTMANIVLALRRDVLQKDVDYGVIPGTGDKPTLLLPGMEKLMRALNAVPEYIEKCVIRDYDRPLFHYEYECRLIDADTGVAIPGGRGIGLCTSFESAFRWRKADRVCPTCGKATIFKSKDKPEWYCWKKKDGCGATFPENDTRITSQVVGRVENIDIFDQVNAIMKRAKKRSLGDAVKGAASVSEFFTVDLEEFARFDEIVDGTYTEIKDESPAEKVSVVVGVPATPKTQPQPTTPQPYKEHELWSAVLNDVYAKNSIHMKRSIAKMVEAGTLKPEMTLEQAVAAVKARKTDDNLPVTRPPETAAPKADPLPESDPAADRLDTLKELENQQVEIYRVEKRDYVNGMGKTAGDKWLAKATFFDSTETEQKIEFMLWPEDVTDIRAAKHDFPPKGGTVYIPVVLKIEKNAIRVKSVPRKDNTPIDESKNLTTGQQMFNDLPGMSDAARNQLEHA